MTAFFPDFFRQQLFANPNTTVFPTRVVLFRSSPSITGTTKYNGIRTVADLVAFPGWQEVSGVTGYPLQTLNLGKRVSGVNNYIMLTSYPFSSLAVPVECAAMALVYVGTLGGTANPVMMVTDTPTSATHINLYPSDSLTALPDATFTDASNKYVFKWATPPTGATTVDLIEGPLVIAKGVPTFEVSNTQHVWMYPQRANMIANPSFERDTAYWAASGAITRTQDAKGAWYGNAAAAAGYVIMESNIFPTLLGKHYAEDWTIQLYARGTGILKVGLIFWNIDYTSTGCDWGVRDDGTKEQWTLNSDSWVHVNVGRKGIDAYTAMVRLEVQGGPLSIDKVLAERGQLRDWAYFDGDETYSARDDFSWYGGSGRRGASYSLWYDNRRAVIGRLFAQTVDPNNPTATVTDTVILQQGMVYQWVPAGISVVPHMDVFYPNDLQSVPPAKSATVMPYYDAATHPDGVVNPWV